MISSNILFSLAEDYKTFQTQVDVDSSTNWTLQDGYKTRGQYVYPLRGIGSGSRGSMEFALMVNHTDVDSMCSRLSGFKFYFHTPADMPNNRKQSVLVSHNQAATISIIPDMIKTEKSLKSYHPNKRQCFFDNERFLKFYTVYTQNNCELECIANVTLKKCGCVKFNMPRLNDTPIC